MATRGRPISCRTRHVAEAAVSMLELIVSEESGLSVTLRSLITASFATRLEPFECGGVVPTDPLRIPPRGSFVIRGCDRRRVQFVAAPPIA